MPYCISHHPGFPPYILQLLLVALARGPLAAAVAALTLHGPVERSTLSLRLEGSRRVGHAGEVLHGPASGHEERAHLAPTGREPGVVGLDDRRQQLDGTLASGDDLPVAAYAERGHAAGSSQLLQRCHLAITLSDGRLHDRPLECPVLGIALRVQELDGGEQVAASIALALA